MREPLTANAIGKTYLVKDAYSKYGNGFPWYKELPHVGIIMSTVKGRQSSGKRILKKGAYSHPMHA